LHSKAIVVANNQGIASNGLLTIMQFIQKVYPDAKGVPGSSVIFFVSSRHVETVVLMSKVEKNRRTEKA
jgi:hypothetical protein